MEDSRDLHALPEDPDSSPVSSNGMELETPSQVFKNPTRQFTERYWLALIVTALLFIISYYLLNFGLDKQGLFVNQINVIGKQNVLSQEIAKKVLILENCDQLKYCERQINSLEKRLNTFNRSQSILLRGDSVLRARGLDNGRLDTLLSRNKTYSQPIVDASRSLIQLKKEEMKARKRSRLEAQLHRQINLNISKMLKRERELTDNLSKMSEEYNQEAQAYIRRLKLYQRLVLGFGALVLLLEAIFLFPPIIRKIRSYLYDLEEAHDDARERNREISVAYHQLKVVEKVTRLNAEALKKTNRDLLKTRDELTFAHQELQDKNTKLEETYNVMHINEQLEAARFLDTAVNHFTNVMRWQTSQSIFSWSDHFLSEFVPYVNGLQAVLYVHDAEKKTLYLTGNYATGNEDLIEKAEVKLGENLVGQVAKSMNPINLEVSDEDAGLLRSLSGTEEIYPKCLIVLPLSYNNEIAGVLEMTAAQPLEKRYIELLDRISENIGAHLSTLLDQKRINQLFADSQLTQKRLRKSVRKIKDNEERFRKLSEVTQEGILFLDGNQIKDANTVLIKMMGYDAPRELIGKHYVDLIAHKYRFEIIDKKMLEDGLAHETVAVRKDGKTFPVEIQSREATYDRELMKVISIRDITEKKRTQKQLEEANRIASLVTELEKKNKDITSSIEYAQRIQQAILPHHELIQEGFEEHFVLYLPKDIVSGDFYWYAHKGDYSLIAAVDCTGHGVPGAFMSIIGYSNLNKIVLEQGITEPGLILENLDKEVTEVLKQKQNGSKSRDGMDLALCAYHRKTQKLQFAGAYRPLYLIRNKQMQEFKGSSFPIGGTFRYRNKKTFTNHEVQLQKGDTLYLFSDGFPDQFGGVDNRKFMTKKFKKLLLNIWEKPLAEQQAQLMHAFQSWKGDYKQMDDILIIGLKI